MIHLSKKCPHGDEIHFTLSPEQEQQLVSETNQQVIDKIHADNEHSQKMLIQSYEEKISLMEQQISQLRISIKGANDHE